MLGCGLWLLAALGIFIRAASQRFSLPAWPLADADYYGYLNPALSKLTGGGFDHSIAREFLYPAFVFLNLCGFGDFRAITISQHFLGLATGGILLMAWQQFLALRRVPAATLGGARGFALAALRQPPALVMVWVYLCDRSTVLAEHTIRPEAVFPLVAALSVWLTLRFVRLRWVDARPSAAWEIGAVQLFVSGVLFMLRPSFAFGVGFVNLPLAVALCARGEPWAAKLRPVAWALAAAVVLLFLPEAVLRRPDRLATTLLPSMRLLVHGDLVLRQLDADLAPGHPTRYDREMLTAFRARLAHALEVSRQPENHPWARLGFNPDYIYLHEGVFEPFFPAADVNADRPLARFCNDYCVRTALHQPLAMGGKVLRQLTFFYEFTPLVKPLFHRLGRRRGERVQFSDDTLYPLALRSFAYPPFHRLLEVSAMGPPYLQACERLARSKRAVPQIAAVQRAARVLTALYLPVLIVALLACALVHWFRAGNHLSLRAWTVLLLYAYNFGTSLTIATVFYLGQGRYIEMQKTFTLFSEFAALCFLGQCAVAAWRQLPRRIEPDVLTDPAP